MNRQIRAHSRIIFDIFIIDISKGWVPEYTKNRLKNIHTVNDALGGV